MKDVVIAKSYAKAITLLDVQGKLKDEVSSFVNILNISNELEQVLFLPLFTLEEKRSVLNEVVQKLKFSNLFKSVLTYLVEEGRISLINIIYKEIIIQEDLKSGFITGELIGSSEKPKDEFVNKLVSRLEKDLGKRVKLNYKTDEKLIAGYKVKIGGNLYDSTVENNINNFKYSI